MPVTFSLAPRYMLCEGELDIPPRPLTSGMEATTEPNGRVAPSPCSRFKRSGLVSLVMASFLLLGDGLPGPGRAGFRPEVLEGRPTHEQSS